MNATEPTEKTIKLDTPSWHIADALRDFVDDGLAQQLQDAFSAALRVPVVIVDRAANPITQPSNWPISCDDGQTCPPLPRESFRRIKNLLLLCREDMAPATNFCPSSGMLTSALPIVVKGTMIGAWIIDQIHLTDLPCDQGDDQSAPRDFGPEEIARKRISLSTEDFVKMSSLLKTINVALTGGAPNRRRRSPRRASECPFHRGNAIRM